MTENLVLSLQTKDLKVPRYTSYPTAPHFHDGITADTYIQWLKEIPGNTATSLYIHVPFCRKLCWFCGCNMRVVNNDEPVERYLALLYKELDIIAKHVNKPKITHLHFGGGSPTIIKSEPFAKLIEKIKQLFYFADNAEIAIEIDPRTVSEDKIAAYARAGVNRASIGVQDFNQKVQESINRVQPLSVVSNAVDTLRKHGISEINMDLIYGLPHQTTEILLDSIKSVVNMKPNRIALFGYAHVPWMKKHQELIDEASLPDTNERFHMIESAKDALVESGYAAIGLDHFALEEDELVKCQKQHTMERNFQGYTTDSTKVLLGVGISSISSLPQGYLQNDLNPSQYEMCLNKGSLPVIKGVAITREDKLRRDIISSLMCYLSVDLKEMTEKHNMPEIDFTHEIEALKPFCDGKILTIDGSTITVAESGRMALRVIASVFDTYLKPEAKKHSAAI